MLRMNQEEEKNTLINSITRDDPKMRARAFLSRLSRKELEIIDNIVEKARRKKCKRCRELNKAMEMYERSEVVLNADDYKGVDYIPVKHTQR